MSVTLVIQNIGCPTTYQTRHFFNNSKTNDDIATKQTHTTDTFLFISHTTNVFLFKSRCNIFIGFRIIKEMPGLVGSGTPCTKRMCRIILSSVACLGLTCFSTLPQKSHDFRGKKIEHKICVSSISTTFA